MSAEFIAIIGGVALFAYPLVMRWLGGIVHPFRLRMAGLASELRESPKVSDRQKNLVFEMASNSFSPLIMMAASIVLPLYSIALIFGFAQSGNLLESDDKDVNEKFRKFIVCHIISSMASNPIFSFVSILFLFPIIIIIIVWALIKRHTIGITLLTRDMISMVANIEDRFYSRDHLRPS